MSVSHGTAQDLLPARERLGQFVRQQATQASADLGFGWVGTPDAPSTYPALQAAFTQSRLTGAPLPVSNLYCDDTIFLDPEDNMSFRFWHDTSHCRLGLTFSLPDEWRLTLRHLVQLERAGYGPGSDEYRLLRLDLLGQIILLGIARRFPHSQGHFTRTCAALGLDAGVLAELERVS
jgi:hypothetical protein